MGVKKLNRKGIFFTFIAVTLIAAIIIIFTPSPSLNIGVEIPVVKTRVTTLNEFVLDLENSYFESILKVSSHKAILALLSHMEANSQFLADSQASFSEAVLHGAINGEKQPIMDGNTIKNWTDRMANVSKNVLNADIEFTINEVNISQLRPWFVELRLNISFSVNSETASWDVKDYIVNAELSIENFNDPYYLVNTNGAYKNKINRTNTTFDKWNVEKTKDHIRSGTYRYNSEAPGFLMRFTNDISPSSCCGIESLVNPNKLSSQKSTSYADYLFWSTADSCAAPDFDLYTVNDISPEFPDFKLDFGHIVLYSLQGQEQQICPPP